MNMTKKPSILWEVAYLIILAIGGVYLFIINYIVEPASWRDWFVHRIPVELAVLNVIVLIALFFSLTLYFDRLTLAIRYLCLSAIICLGSFLKISIQVAPLLGVPIILVSILV